MSAGAHLVKGVPCDGADLGRQAMDVGSAQGLPVNLRPSDSTQGITPESAIKQRFRPCLKVRPADMGRAATSFVLAVRQQQEATAEAPLHSPQPMHMPGTEQQIQEPHHSPGQAEICSRAK